MPQYRIATDNYLGYEVQCKYSWWPFWIGDANTFASVQRAEEYANALAKRKRRRRVVKELGYLGNAK